MYQNLFLLSLFFIVLATGFTLFTYSNLTSRGVSKIENLEFGSLGVNIVDDDKKETSIIGDTIIQDSNFVREKNIKVQNTGTLNGRLYIRLLNVINEENGCNSAELSAEPTCQTDNQGELGQNMKFTVYQDNREVAQTNLDNTSAANFANLWSSLPPVLVKGKSTQNLRVVIGLNGQSFGNEVQSDQLSFDIEYRLDQI